MTGTRLWMKRGDPHLLGLGKIGYPAPRWASPTSFYNKKLAADHPVINDANQYASRLIKQFRYSTTSTPRTGYYDPPYNINVGTTSYSIPIWVAPAADYPKRTVYMKRNETRKATGTFTSGSNTVTSVAMASGAPAWQVGDKIWAPGGWNRTTPGTGQAPCLNHGVTVTAVSGSTLTLSATAIASGTAIALFSTAGPNSFLNTLQNEMLQIPVPLQADLPTPKRLEAAGTDQACTIYDPFTDTMYEFWLFDGNEDIGYYFNYGGVIHNFSQSDGTIPNTWGVRATSLAAACGLMQLQEYRDGEFPHKIAVAIPVTAGTHLAPATRNDHMSLIPSGSFADEVPEGTMFRFPASMTINPAWPRFVRILVKAIRDYGLIVSDTGGVVQFFFEDYRTAGSMFSRASAVVSGELTSVSSDLNVIPWENLQQIAYIP